MYASSSLSTVFVPINAPAVVASAHGMPMIQTRGANAMPSTRCSVTGAPATSGSSARIWLARLTNATSTTSIATMLTRSWAPSTVPRVTASMLEVAAWDTSFPSVAGAFPGTMSTEIAIAAGAHGLLQEKRKPLHDPGKHPPVKEQRGQRAHDEHERQRPERENEARARISLRERKRPAAQEPEDEGCSLPRRFLKRVERIVEEKEDLLEQGHLQEEDSEHERQQHSGDDRTPGDGPAILAEGPGDGMQKEKPDQAVNDEPGAHARFRGQVRLKPSSMPTKYVTTPAPPPITSMRSPSRKALRPVNRLIIDT